MLKPNDKVKMSEAFKERLRNNCKTHHVGPFDPDDPSQCWGCSSDHVKEFGECIGVVVGYTNWSDGVVGPEVDVKWLPDNLKYAYDEDDLVKIE